MRAIETMKNLLSEKDTEIVLQILTDELAVPREQLTPEANLTGDLAADSLTVIQIIMALEERLEIAIPDERSEEVRTIGDVFKTVSELLQERLDRNHLRGIHN